MLAGRWQAGPEEPLMLLGQHAVPLGRAGGLQAVAHLAPTLPQLAPSSG